VDACYVLDAALPIREREGYEDFQPLAEGSQRCKPENSDLPALECSNVAGGSMRERCEAPENVQSMHCSRPGNLHQHGDSPAAEHL
jgi:hypothetical protein